MKPVGIGIIGVGNRGTQLLHALMKNQECTVVALCDAYKPYVTRNPTDIDPVFAASGKCPAMGEELGDYAQYRDYRDLLADENVEAVIVATPDHWHAKQTIDAFRADKDVFVEKPLTLTIREGRRMVEVQRQTDRVCGVCLNRRGSSIYRKCVEMVQGGTIGDVKAAYASHTSVMWPNGIGKEVPTEPPANLDWDLWLGPQEKRPYKINIAPYSFRWHSDFSSQMGNWGVHFMDVIRWMMGERAPRAVTAVGSRTTIDDDRSIPDTMAVLFEMENGAVIHFDINEASAALRPPEGEVMLCGTQGTLTVDQNAAVITPTRPGQFQAWEPAVEPKRFEIGGDDAYGDLGIKEDSTQNLIDDFVACVRTREHPICGLEEAHRSTSFAHLANISLRLGKRIEWNEDEERITNDEAVNSLLHYEYRSPWRIDFPNS